MANIKITDLTVHTAPAADDVLPIVDVDADVTKQIAVGEIIGKITGDVDVATNGTSSIASGAIVDADVNTSAAIAGTKINPGFGSQNVTTTGTITGASLNPTSNTVPTNGVYLPAANSVGISTNGTGKLFVDANGNVGIGSSGSGSQSARTFIEGSGACPLELDATAASGGYLALSNNGAAKVFFGFGSNIGTASVNDVAIRSQSGALAFQTNGANDRLSITSDGKVGVGNTGPSYKLDVTGGFRVSGLGTTAFSVDASSPNNSLIIDSSGRCLVGTSTSPSASYTSIKANGAILQNSYTNSFNIDAGNSDTVDITTLVEAGYTYQVFAKVNNGSGGTDGHLVALVTVIGSGSVEGYLEIAIGSGSGRSVVHSGSGVFTFTSSSFGSRCGILVTCIGVNFGT